MPIRICFCIWDTSSAEGKSPTIFCELACGEEDCAVCSVVGACGLKRVPSAVAFAAALGGEGGTELGRFRGLPGLAFRPGRVASCSYLCTVELKCRYEFVRGYGGTG